MTDHSKPIDMNETIHRDSFERWSMIRSRVLQITTDLGTISAQSENDFMRLGNSLMESNDAGMAVEQKAMDIVSFTGTDLGRDGFSSLKKGIESSMAELRQNRESIVSQSLSVKHVLDHLCLLQSKNDDIERLAKYLRAVALNIFIETSRSHVVSENFSIIAGEIKQLSENIINLAKIIHEKVDDAEKQFSAAFADIQSGLIELEVLTAHGEKSVHEAVSKTDAWLVQAGKTASQSVSSGQEVTGHVGEIVMALQFHDAMRQRLEHIGTGLSDMVALCDKNENTAFSDSETPSMLHALSALLSDQLEQIICEIEEVHVQCNRAFDSIGANMNDMAQRISRMVGGGKDNRERRMNADSGEFLVSSLREFKAIHNRGGDLIRRMEEIYAMSAQTTAALTELIGRIHEISRDAHVKGINAIIAASHLGQEGRTLSVLAGEMKGLSDLTDIFVKDVELIIRNLLLDGDTSDKNGEGENEGAAGFDEIFAAILRLIETMKHEAGELHLRMETIDTLHLRVKNELQFIPAMGRKLGEQKRHLSGLVKELEPFADKRSLENLDHSFMAQRYTMEKERLVHKKSISGSGELADKHEDSPASTNDLGDNFELF